MTTEGTESLSGSGPDNRPRARVRASAPELTEPVRPPSPKTYYIETWGCQMNDLDSQRLSGQLLLRGYRKVEDAGDASLILLNTCSIREKAEQKVFSRLGHLREAKANGSTIGVCGCVAQQEGQAILERMPHVDFVIGPGQVGYLDEVLEGRVRLALEFPVDRRYDELAIERTSPVKAQVTIIEGCNKNCTFCIVPTTRGREVSRPLRQVLREVRHAVSTGHVEIELLGQTVNAYRCPETAVGFPELLEAVSDVDGVMRVRFVTSHPAEVSRRMLEVMRDRDNICKYLHLPVQSGSNTVLRRMKRLYTRERYLALVDEIRELMPSMKFSTDLIVGFPGESDEDFEQTLDLMRRVRYGSLFAFAYSPRPGTPALRLGRPVDEAVSRERLRLILELQETMEQEALRSYVGREVTVLHEGESRHDPQVCSGRTDDNWVVNFTASGPIAPGTLVRVRIDRAQHHSLRGEALPSC